MAVLESAEVKIAYQGIISDLNSGIMFFFLETLLSADVHPRRRWDENT